MVRASLFRFIQRFRSWPQHGRVDMKEYRKWKSYYTKKFDEKPRMPHGEDYAILKAVREKTSVANLNNRTRTDAYLAFFTNHPEIHWALLAHLVSRNGGWSMTDLKGEWFTRIAPPIESSRFFHFLERANWLIFQDAYPQLLLYEETLRREENLFHLLPHLHVSSIMKPTWDSFLEFKDSRLLTHALIINEQNYIHKQLVLNAEYAKGVVDSLNFQLQSLLQLNTVLLPYFDGPSSVRLYGRVIRDFTSLEQRICTGLALYKVLFADGNRLRSVLQWAAKHPHTGSRSDYFPDIFSSVNHIDLQKPYRPHFGIIENAAEKVYSPELTSVWNNVHHPEASHRDWREDLNFIRQLVLDIPVKASDVTLQYVTSIKLIEGLILAKEATLGRKMDRVT